jgi:hypothetical protein
LLAYQAKNPVSKLAFIMFNLCRYAALAAQAEKNAVKSIAELKA